MKENFSLLKKTPIPLKVLIKVLHPANSAIGSIHFLLGYDTCTREYLKEVVEFRKQCKLLYEDDHKVPEGKTYFKVLKVESEIYVLFCTLEEFQEYIL